MTAQNSPLSRRAFLGAASAGTFAALMAAHLPAARADEILSVPALDKAQAQDWLARWEKRIQQEAAAMNCDKERGEELGWLISPILNGFYYGYLVTHDPKWIGRLADCADMLLHSAVREPDGFDGWPKAGASGTDVDGSNTFNADSLLGEAMVWRPIILAAGLIRRDARLREKFGTRADLWLNLANLLFEKWDKRGVWRETPEGGIWIVQAYGINDDSRKWTDGFENRLQSREGFSLPNNKANLVALWHLALFDVTGNKICRERAEKWFRLFKTRWRNRGEGKFLEWDYWSPAGRWDFSRDMLAKHWIGVHPNGGYYHADVEAVAAAFAHGLVFTRADLDKLIATNRDFMWNQKMEGAAFQRIDGGQPDPRWQKTPGVLWTALTPYDETLRKIFLANHDPASWSGMSATPWFLSLQKRA